MKEFQINEYIVLKLIDSKTHIFVAGERFLQCKHLLIMNPQNNPDLKEIKSIDEANSLFGSDLEEIEPIDLGITPEQEFWGHCSNLQAWAENNYDTRLIHSNMVFPLLRKLKEKFPETFTLILKEEIIKRILVEKLQFFGYLKYNHYLSIFTKEEMADLLHDLLKKRYYEKFLYIEYFFHDNFGIKYQLALEREEFWNFFPNHKNFRILKELESDLGSPFILFSLDDEFGFLEDSGTNQLGFVMNQDTIEDLSFYNFKLNKDKWDWIFSKFSKLTDLKRIFIQRCNLKEIHITKINKITIIIED